MVSSKKKFHLQNINVEKYAAEGKSIAYYNDKVLFIEGAIPGDVVDVFVTKNKAAWAEASVTKITTLSALRVPKFCAHFSDESKACGGCKWQTLPYTLQLAYKEQQVKDQLTRIGKVEAQRWLPIIGCSQDRYYRNKVEFTFSNKRYLLPTELNTDITPEQNVLGYHAPRLFDKVIDIDTCHLQAEPTNAIKNYIRQFALENTYTFYDARMHTGELRNIVIRISSIGQILVNIIFGSTTTDRITLLMQTVKVQFPEITSLHYTVNTKMNDTIYDIPVIHYSGTETIEEKLDDYIFAISPKSFFQTNTEQAEKLYTVVRKLANFTGKEILYDLYCGTGSIGIFCSAEVQKIVGVEAVDDAIKDAKANAEKNNISNAHFFAGDVIKICTQTFFDQHGKPDIIITDPPRAGMHETLVTKLLEIQAPKIIYVSCNPSTQARDLLLLQEKYIVATVQPVDMFPHTHHIENVVLLLLK